MLIEGSLHAFENLDNFQLQAFNINDDDAEQEFKPVQIYKPVTSIGSECFF
jgi:hypothetical protein